jgi:putative transposase
VSASLPDATPPSIRTVSYWIAAFQRRKEESLPPRHARRGNRTIRFSVEVEQLISDAIENQFLRREWGGGDAVHSQVIGRAAELGLCDSRGSKIKLPSIRTIQRRLKQLDPHTVAHAQQGSLAASRLARAAGRSIDARNCLSIVQMDTHKLDVLVVDPDTGDVLGRPFLTCVLDVHTRCIVGTYISMYDPSATTALAALKDMLIRYGIPTVIIPDNGVEFANSAFISVCGTLKITISPAQSRDPNGKAHVESFFRTFTYALIQSLAGTTFSSPASKGDYDSSRNALFSLQQVKSFSDEWINEVYHKTVHSRTLRAPAIAWEEKTKVMRPLKLTAAEVNVLARRPYERAIHGGRVQFEGLHYYSHALASLENQGSSKITILIDELNLQTIFFENPTVRDAYLMAESTDPDYTEGLTLFEHTEAMKIKKALSNADRRRLGPNANRIARWTLISRIQNESEVAKKWLRKLTNGVGRTRFKPDVKSDMREYREQEQIEQVDCRPDSVAPQYTSLASNNLATRWNAIPTIESLDTE